MSKKRANSVRQKAQKSQPQHNANLIGIFNEGVISPVQRKDPFPGFILKNKVPLKDGDVVIYRLGKTFEILEHLGNIQDHYIYPKIAAYIYDLPHIFSDECLHIKEHNNSSHSNLTAIPFVTIDGADAKDFDDAVYAEPHPEGWKLMVAIADVSHYVTQDSPLDREAKKRGNSVYFPDYVIPMLPEKLSNDLCSLRPHENRFTLAVEIIIGHKGKLISFKFIRAQICSIARLTYKEVHDALNGSFTEKTSSLNNIIQNLHGAYLSLNESKKIRGTLNIDLDEYKILFDKHKKPQSCIIDKDYISHKIIEEFMIIANVCAAKILLIKKMPSIYRNHDKPDEKRYFNLRDTLENLGEKIPRNKALTPHLFNDILRQTQDKPYQSFIQELILRCQAQAQYSAYNKGHFGLSLQNYCHFTSPIRRYADLIVHRALISCLNLGNSEKDLPDTLSLDEIALEISKTERQAAIAERSVTERYMLSLLQKEINTVKEGVIVGVIASGIFVRVQGMSIDGFIPIRTLIDDYYNYDETHHRFIGKRKKKIYQLGGNVLVKIINSNPINEQLILKVEEKRKKYSIKL